LSGELRAASPELLSGKSFDVEGEGGPDGAEYPGVTLCYKAVAPMGQNTFALIFLLQSGSRMGLNTFEVARLKASTGSVPRSGINSDS
jgi:hypothetical protein